MRGRLNWWWVVAAYMVGIFYLSSVSGLRPPVSFKMSDKVSHFVEYGGLAIVTFIALRRSKPLWSLLGLAIMAVVISSVYGVTDEFHQRFVKFRSCDSLDWLADTIGAVIGVLIICLVLKLKKRRNYELKANR